MAAYRYPYFASLDEARAVRRWHAHFTWWPRRIRPDKVVWLQWIARRIDPIQHVTDTYLCGPLWQYGPLVNILDPDPEENNDPCTDPWPDPLASKTHNVRAP